MELCRNFESFWLNFVDKYVNVATSVTRLVKLLQVLGTKLSPKSSPNILVNFWDICNNVTCLQISAWLLFGQFWREIRQFLFQHVVTLIRNLTINHLSKTTGSLFIGLWAKSFVILVPVFIMYRPTCRHVYVQLNVLCHEKCL